MNNSQLKSSSADILIVDDSLEILQLLNVLLTGQGYDVRPARNGEDALEAVKRRQPDLILLDVRMPGMNGFEISRQLKSDPDTQEIPIIFISGLEEASDKVRAFDAGGVDYIIKPFEESEVLARVHTHLALAHTRNSLQTLTEQLEQRVQQRTAELASSEERLAMVLEGSQQGFWDWNIETGEVQRNEQWAKMLGYDSIKEFEANTDTWTDNIHPDDRDAAWVAINDHLEGRTPAYKIEYRMLTKDGGIVWTLDQAKIVKRDADGRPLRMSGTHTDISDIKKADQEKEGLQQQLQQAQKMESIGQLTGGIAHEFNNMLAAILGYTELSINLFATDPESKLSQYLHQILNSGVRARDLVAKMLAFGRSSPGVLRSIDGAATIAEVVELLAPTLPSSLSFHIDVEDEVSLLQGDLSLLQQVLTNLIINAYHAVGEHGKIELGLRAVQHHESVCSSCHQQFSGEFIEISVRDDGEGISELQLEHIFEPFYTTKDVDKGTGMGLSIVDGILHQCGGHILVDTELGIGSVFRLLFQPALIDSVEPAANDAFLSAPLVENKCIMVVDDEVGISSFMSELLIGMGYQVHAFNDPLAALELFKTDSDSIDLVVTDQSMPNLTGVELAQELLLLRPNLPIILCTGYSESFDEASVKRLGIAELLNKPVSSGQILRSIATLLSVEK